MQDNEKVTKSAITKWRNNRRHYGNTKDMFFTVVENRIAGHAWPMWVRYYQTPKADSYLDKTETEHKENLSGPQKNKYIPKSMGHGGLDGLFYIPQNATNIDYEAFMAEITEFSFRFSPGYRATHQPFNPKDPQNHPYRKGSFEGFLLGPEYQILEQMGRVLSHKVHWVHDKFYADSSVDLTTTNTNDPTDPISYLMMASKS